MQFCFALSVFLINLGIVFGNTNEFFDCPHWPHLMILGAQKAGTTSLYQGLIKHPDLCDAKKNANELGYYSKEVHFFDIKMDRFKKGPQFYCSRFETCKHKKKALHIDCTPDYLEYGVAQRMKRTFSPKDRKKIKLIAILREPVQRMLSWYNHLRSIIPLEGKAACERDGYCKLIYRNHYEKEKCTKKEGDIKNKDDCISHVASKKIKIPQGNQFGEFITFKEFALVNNHSVEKGQYVDILKEFIDVFGDQNILVLNYDFMMNNQRKTLSLISKFVGIDDTWSSNFKFPHVNERNANVKKDLDDIDCEFLRELDNYFSPYNKRLYSMLHSNRKKFWSGQPHFRRFEQIVHCTKKKVIYGYLEMSNNTSIS